MQQDLFGSQPAASQSSSYSNPNRMDFSEKYRLSLRLDQGIVALIAMLVIYVLVFSFGVEKGKRFAMAELRAEREKRERMVEEFRQKLYEKEAAENQVPVLKVPGLPRVQQAEGKQEISNLALLEPVPGVAATAGKYTIQVITFKSKDAAEKEISRFTQTGHQGFVIPNGSFQQVCVDRFESREKAVRVLGELKSQGLAPHDAYVRNIPQ